MITFVEGKLAHKDPTQVIVEINGIGYEVKISLNTFSALKDAEHYKLHTYLHIKEDSHTLYGFAELEEKMIFLNLISISGIGPSTGLIMLSSLSPFEIKSAIVNGDVQLIQGVKGIGSKTAQRVILELKDKIARDELIEKAVDLSSNSYNTIKNEALSALITLGINKNLAEKKIDMLLRENEDLALEELIKLTLKNT